MKSSTRFPVVPIARATMLAGLLLAPLAASAQVTYFERPPTPDQLRAALLRPATPMAAPGSAPGALPSGTRTRGIVGNMSWGNAPATASASAAAPMPVAAAAPAASPAAPANRPPASAPAPVAAGGGQPAAALPINFDLGSSRVDPNSVGYIESIASVLKSDPSIRLVIEGHTDASGSYNRNMVLSWDRALGVFRTLVESYGIDPSRLQPVGRGPLEPMPGTAPNDGTNRRVQFRISG